jgi:hypothetical protein
MIRKYIPHASYDDLVSLLDEFTVSRPKRCPAVVVGTLGAGIVLAVARPHSPFTARGSFEQMAQNCLQATNHPSDQNQKPLSRSCNRSLL